MKKILLLLVMLVSTSMFSQIGTHNFTRSLNTRFETLFKENKSTLIVLNAPNYGDIKLIINNHEAYFESESPCEEFTNDATGTHLIYFLLINRRTKERVALKFYYEGLNPVAIFIFSDGKKLLLQNELRF
ncbi:hypothetical protein EKL97_12315 [Flavobacterium sp. LS1P28]|uniref:hypothetical protein n=1 Tax=Flavobacterium sp. LS1P28 TaxID=2497752 RepID=UPI000F82C511|nr:hypothetical protein [Flavobacterium sp. LS1P28]RTY79652.1 hypothetical protein EKL97_12315 [Flavobacterium sp. LS1P28]